MWESAKLRCSECGHTYDDLIKRSERDQPHICPECGSNTALRTLSAPSIRTSDSASHLDGTNRFAKLKESWSLRKAKAKAKSDRKPAEEKRISKEISKLNK
jgi:putative FmdB family regulatory protein